MNAPAINSIRKLYREFRTDPLSSGIFAALSGGIFIVAMAGWAIELLLPLHWSLAALLITASGWFVVWLAFHAGSLRRRDSISMGLVIFLTLALLGSLVGAGCSYILSMQDWAYYKTPDDVKLITYFYYYLWSILDMVPALDIWQTLPIEPPVKPADVVAGIPVLVFKIFILGYLFISIRRWWKHQETDKPDKTTR